MTQYNDDGAKADHVVMLAVSWTLFSSALLFFLARLAIRVHYSKRIFWDDGWAFFALLCLLANVVLLTAMLKPMYVTIQMQKFSASIKRSELTDLDKRAGAPTTPNFLSSITVFLRFQFAETMVFWTCVWSVKASFLAFFKRLTRNVKGHLAAWWVIVVITALAYIGSVITYPVSCSDFSPMGCTKPENVRLSLVSLRFSTCVDVITDLMIIALPMSLAWRVKLPWRHRLALFGVFALGGIIILFAITRVAFVNRKHRQPEISWLNLWSAVEASIACIVCNLAPFKILFPSRARKYSSSPYAYGRGYGQDEKMPVESHELSTSSRSGQPTHNDTMKAFYNTRSSLRHPARPSMALVSRDRPSNTHLPRGVHKGFLRVSISVDQRRCSDSERRGGILVTQEVERKVATADEVTVASEDMDRERERSCSRSRSRSMRTTWIERTSQESADRISPQTPGIKAFA